MGELLPGAAPYSAELTQRIREARTAQGSRRPPRTKHLDVAGRPVYTNRLVLETSPYLVQHAHNPVDWRPWGDEAFEVALKEHKPVLLSIGYSTCHWCHVMEEESFEDLEVARYLNENYVAIKVDREARPDLDAVYMAAVQGFTGRGGWPMTVWLTPDRKPFYGGTYFPKDDILQGGSSYPGFATLLRRLREVVDQDPADVERVANRVVAALAEQMVPAMSEGLPSMNVLDTALGHYTTMFDPAYGGLRQSMKFPASLPIPFLLREYVRTGKPEALTMATRTLDAMHRGGLYDQVGGGFHRYATDPTWTVPHFEKMLYDNAMLVIAYLEGYQATGDSAYAAVVRDVLEYVGREMTSADGTFYAATDADSEGEEGRFFVWNPAQVREAVGEDLAPLALRAYDVSEAGNFEGGHSVLRRDATLEELAESEGVPVAEIESRLNEVRRRLYAARAKRVAPLRDEKEIVAWNGLMLSAFAKAGLVLDEPAFVERAERAAQAILAQTQVDGRLARYLRDGKAYERGLLQDYAYLEAGLLDLFEATADPRWFDAARALQETLDAQFWDTKGGGYFSTASDAESLLVRQKGLDDGALPSANAIAAINLVRLASLTTQRSYRERAEKLLQCFAKRIEEMPASSGDMLQALSSYFAASKEVLIIAPKERREAHAFVQVLSRQFVPHRVLVVASESQAQALASRIPLLEGKLALGGEVTAYVCENRTCARPAKDLETFTKQLQ